MPTPKKPGDSAANEEATPDEDATEEKLSRDDVVALVNSAMSAHGKRLEKRILEAMASSKPADDEQPERPAKKTSQASNEVAELRKMLEDERNQRRMTEAQKVLSEQLTEAGIKPGLQKFVLGHLLHSEKALAFDEAGNPKLTVRRSRAAGTPVEEVEFEDLAAGIKDWLKGDDAKHFLPAPASPKSAPREAPAPRVNLHGEQQQGNQGGRQPAEHIDDAVDRVRSTLGAAGIHIT